MRIPIFCTVMMYLISTSQAATNAVDTDDYHFLVFSGECFNKFFNQREFTNTACIELTMSKIVGLGIILFSIVLKVPQIVKIIEAKSVEGISYLSFVFETVLYFFIVSYNLFKNNPFSLYGENVFIIVQNITVMILFAKYGKKFSPYQLLATFLFFAGITAPLLLQLVPPQLYEFSLIINIIIFFFSRAPQIYSNFKHKSTGQLAISTSFLDFIGSIARTFTILAEAPNTVVLVNNFEAVFLNGLIISQICIFWQPKTKKE